MTFEQKCTRSQTLGPKEKREFDIFSFLADSDFELPVFPYSPFLLLLSINLSADDLLEVRETLITSGCIPPVIRKQLSTLIGQRT